MFDKSRLLLVYLFLLCSDAAFSQQPKPPSPAEIRSLDVKAEKAEQDYLKSLVELATDYENAGDVERSKGVLRQILKLKPDTESVKNKLKQYEEEVFDRQSTVIDVDVARGWVSTGILVTKDLPVRLEAAGNYRLVINEELGPNGYQADDATKDLLAGIPTGALIGMIAQPRRQKNAPEPRPFLIGDAKEIKPGESGVLFLKVNSPPQAKCTGKLKVKLSGNISR